VYIIKYSNFEQCTSSSIQTLNSVHHQVFKLKIKTPLFKSSIGPLSQQTS